MCGRPAAGLEHGRGQLYRGPTHPGLLRTYACMYTARVVLLPAGCRAPYGALAHIKNTRVVM